MSIFKRKPKPPTFTGNCLVRTFTGDGEYTGDKCWHSTYDGICPSHGDVLHYLKHYGWPRDFELPMYDGSPWAENLREKWKNR